MERGERSGQTFEVGGLARKTDIQIVGGLGAAVQNGRPAADDYEIDLRINQRLYRSRSSSAGPPRLFGRLADVVHAADALGGREAQLLYQERQVDAEALGRFDAAAGRGVVQPVFGAGEFGGG